MIRLRDLHYGWIMVVLAGFVLATNTLAFFGFGVFLKPLTAEFGWERGAISGAMSAGALVTGVLSLITGRLSDRYGPRILVTGAGLSLGTAFLLMSQIGLLWQVYLVWGLFVGSAISCSVIPINSTIPRWFREKRGLAIVIPLTGFSVGAMVSPLLVQWLIFEYGWRLTFLILAFIPFIITIPIAQFLKQDPRQKGLRPYGESELIEEDQSKGPAVWGLSVTQAIKTKRFWVFGLLWFSFFFCVQIIVVHIVPHAIDTGIPVMAAASILSFAGASSVVGRLSMGVLADKIGNRMAMSICLILIALAFVWLLLAREIWMFYVFAVVFGLAWGGVAPLLTLVLAELFGLKFLGAIFGVGMFVSTLGGALGAPFAGYIFDVTGSYSPAFSTSVALAALAIVLSLVLLRYKGEEIIPQ